MTDYVRAYKDPRECYHREALGVAAKFESDAFVVDGVARWRANRQVPPDDILLLWQHLGKPFDCEKTKKTSAEELDEFIKNYRKNWRPPSAEQRAEMRAEGLSGVMVDVVAGRRYRV